MPITLDGTNGIQNASWGKRYSWNESTTSWIELV
jgi:hypothetical protein